jgi:hypothetical protein
MKICLLIITLICSSGLALAELEDSTKFLAQRSDRWWIPDFAVVQFAGNIGVGSAGIGYSNRKETYQLAALYGYCPASITGIEIHTVTARNNFNLYKFQLPDRKTILPYASLGISFELGGRAFFTLPDNMPEGYYNFPKSVHAIASGGLKFRRPTKRNILFEAVEFYVEGSTVDAYIWYKVRSDEIRMTDIVSLAIGVQFVRKSH